MKTNYKKLNIQIFNVCPTNFTNLKSQDSFLATQWSESSQKNSSIKHVSLWQELKGKKTQMPIPTYSNSSSTNHHPSISHSKEFKSFQVRVLKPKTFQTQKKINKYIEMFICFLKNRCFKGEYAARIVPELESEMGFCVLWRRIN